MTEDLVSPCRKLQGLGRRTKAGPGGNCAGRIAQATAQPGRERRSSGDANGRCRRGLGVQSGLTLPTKPYPLNIRRLDLEDCREGLIDIARTVGEVIMAVYATDFAVRGTLVGEQLRFGKPGFENPHFFAEGHCG